MPNFLKEFRTEKRWSKWRSPLLLSVLLLFIVNTLSGFVLYFFKPFVSSHHSLVFFHWALSLIALLPYLIYQLRHYLLVKNLGQTLHFKIGLCTFISMLIVILSGVFIIPGFTSDFKLAKLINLMHVFSSSAFLIFICSHLVLVWRVALRKKLSLKSHN